MRHPLRGRTLLAAALVLPALALMAGTPQKPAAKKGPKKAPNPVAVIKTSMGDIEVELFIHAAPETVKNFLGLAMGTKEYTDPKTKKKAKGHYYDGLIFHRVIKNFMLQGGCPLGTGSGNPGFMFDDEINAKALGLDKLKLFQANGRPHPWVLPGIRNNQDFNYKIIRPLQAKFGIRSREDWEKKKDAFQKYIKTVTLQQCYEAMGYKYNDKLEAHKPLRGYLAMANSGPGTNGSQFFLNLKDTPWLTGKHTVFGKVVKGMDVVDKIGEVAVGQGARPLKPVKILSVRPKGAAGATDKGDAKETGDAKEPTPPVKK